MNKRKKVAQHKHRVRAKKLELRRKASGVAAVRTPARPSSAVNESSVTEAAAAPARTTRPRQRPVAAATATATASPPTQAGAEAETPAAAARPTRRRRTTEEAPAATEAGAVAEAEAPAAAEAGAAAEAEPCSGGGGSRERMLLQRQRPGRQPRQRLHHGQHAPAAGPQRRIHLQRLRHNTASKRRTWLKDRSAGAQPKTIKRRATAPQMRGCLLNALTRRRSATDTVARVVT